MKSNTALLVFAIALIAPPAARAQSQDADLILTNARIYTVDAARPRAQAVAIRSGRIIFVGSAQEVTALRGATTRVLDLAGKTVIPGMIDAHGHLTGLGSTLRMVDLVGTTSYDEIVERVRQK